MQKVRANISLKAISHNALAFKNFTQTRVCAVVKANAYGHGAEQVTNALHSIVDCFAVSLFDEAKAIRVAACGKDILVLTPPLCDEEAYSGIVNGFLITVADMDRAKKLVGLATTYRLPVRVHLKVNTGMNRYGMDVSTLESVCKIFKNCPLVKVEGIYSHIYKTDEKTANKQRKLFMKAQDICKRYYPQCLAHISATYGATLGSAFALDMVRIGIGLYGYYPDGAHISTKVKKSLGLQKAMRVTATVVDSRAYGFGGAGYGIPVWVKKGERPPQNISVCRIGYADGILRRQSNGTEISLQYANAACMDASILIGERLRGEELCILQDAAKTAKQTGTISYEVLCAATRRAELIYDGK